MNKAFKYLLLINNILFVSLYLILAFNNRLAIDDYFYIQHFNEHGVINGVIEEYNRWSTRYFSVFLYFLVLSFSWFKYYLFVFGIISLFGFVASISFFLKSLNNSLLKYKEFNLFKRVNISLLIISAFFYSTISIGETWFWLCASCTYLICIVMLFWGIGLIIDTNKSSYTKYLCIIPFSYIGGSLGPLAILLIFVLLLVYLIIKFKVKIIHNNILSKLSTSLTSCLVAFVILYLGHGNVNRENCFDEVSLIESVFFNFKALYMIYLQIVPKALIYIILFSILAVAVTKPIKGITNLSFKNIIIYLVLSAFTLIYLYQLPISYKTQDMAALRALFPVTVILLICSWIFVYYLSYNYLKSDKIIKIISIATITIILSLNIHTIYNQYIISSKYSKSLDLRILNVKQNDNRVDYHLLDSLPSSGFLKSAEITQDSLHFSNRYFRDAIGLKNNVVLK